MSDTTPIPARLEAVEAELREIFTDIRVANDAAHQDDAHLREAVSATSAAIAAVERAHRHAASSPNGGGQ